MGASSFEWYSLFIFGYRYYLACSKEGEQMAKFVVVDLETTGHSPKKGDKIIEIGMVTIVDGVITDQYKSFVHPEQPIPSFISQLTGIQDADVQGAPLFDEIVEDVVSRLDGAYFVAHHVEFDLGFLDYAIREVTGHKLSMPVIDTVELARILMPQAPGYKLGQLAEFFNVSHKDPHRALADAYVTGEILLKLLHKAKGLPYETLSHLLQLEAKLKSDVSELLQGIVNEKAFSLDHTEMDLFRGIAVRKQEEYEEVSHTSQESFAPFLENTFQQEGYLHKHMDKYEDRKGQREMATTIYDAFQSQTHAMIEAETGTGKSLGYLIPALYEVMETGERVVVSTHTTQLQSQLIEKELPFLQKALPFSFSSALLKGKQHYLSLKKFEHELFSPTSDNYDVALTKAMILVWLTETTTGDRDEIQLPSSGQIFWRKVSAEAEGYADPKSLWYRMSFYQQAKKRAQKADIIITNHSLLCTDIIRQNGLIASYKKIIVDEAHHLESSAAKHFGLRLDYVTIQYLVNEMGGNQNGDWMYNVLSAYPELSMRLDIRKWDQYMQRIREEADELFRFIFSYVVKKHNAEITLNDVGRFQYRYQKGQEDVTTWNTIEEMTHRVSFYMRDAIQFLHQCKQYITMAETSNEATRWTEDITMYMERLETIINGLQELLIEDQKHLVKWIELEAYGAKNAVFLYSEPIEVASMLSEHFFDKKESVILTSATLTMKDSFSFMLKRLGLPNEDTIQYKIPSPFQYDEQVQLLIPNDFPSVKYGEQEAFVHATCEAIYSLANVTEGRMLVLFTSYDMLKKTYYVMKDFMDQEEFMLIAQGISSGSRTRLKKNFQAFDKAILFGTSSFWEGVDIPGEDLTSLVIVRLPFQPPDHPVYEAKSQSLKESGKNAFMELSLPNAVLRFKQGFGRLIRSSSDRGIVFVCDDRIVRAKYGKYFLDSIPDMPVHFDSTTKLIKQAKEWL